MQKIYDHEITFNERTPNQVRRCAKFIIEKILPVASKHNGQVFGGFVRDILIPYHHLNKKLEECENFKDLDLWFKTVEDAKNFVEEAGSYLPCKIDFDLSKQGIGQCRNVGLYDFNMFHTVLVNGFETPISFVDIVVSDKFPVNDFDVNMMSYKLTSDAEMGGHLKMKYEYHGKGDPVECVKTKTCHMTREYLEKVCSHVENVCHYTHLARVKRRYMDRGWTVMYGDYVFENDDLLIRNTRNFFGWNNRESMNFTRQYVEELKELL
jgi:hypothetical protein